MSETIQPEIVPERVLIFDTTLRDGEQTPGVSFDLDDKLEIAYDLRNLRADIIEAGSPFSGDADKEAVRIIAERVIGPTICALARIDDRTDHADIRDASDALAAAGERGSARIHAYIGTSDYQMEKLKLGEEEIIVATRSGIMRAKEFTSDVQFSPEDASRSDFDFMMRVILEAVDAGATTINIPDTVGKAQPEEYAKMLATAKKAIEDRFGKDAVTISAHCHDDMGNATANTVAAVILGGARQVEVALGSLGERAGNASSEEVAANFKESFPEFTTGIQTHLLTPVVRRAMKRAGIILQPNKAIVGRNAFFTESGTHQAGIRKKRKTYEHLVAEDYGQVGGKMEIGKLSGKAGFADRLEALGMKLESETVVVGSKAAKGFGEAQKRPLADTDIERIAAEISGETLVNHFRLGRTTYQSETVPVDDSDDEFENSATFELTITDNTTNESVTDITESVGGVIDAAVLAINETTGFNGQIVEWRGNSSNRGSDAIGKMLVEVHQNGHSVTAYAEATNVIDASVQAYVKAVNLIERINQRYSEKQDSNLKEAVKA